MKDMFSGQKVLFAGIILFTVFYRLISKGTKVMLDASAEDPWESIYSHRLSIHHQACSEEADDGGGKRDSLVAIPKLSLSMCLADQTNPLYPLQMAEEEEKVIKGK